MNETALPPSTAGFLWGAAAGALALAFVGFTWGGWMTGNGAERMASTRVDTAMVTALAPICVSQFQAAAKAKANLAALKAVQSWEQAEYIQKGGWATMPGAKDEPSREVAAACAEALTKLAQ